MLRRQLPFHNGLMPALATKNLFLAEKSNKCDWHITESLKGNLVYEETTFYHLNQWIGQNRTGDIIFSVSLHAVTLQKTINISPFTHMCVLKDKTFSLQKNRRITEICFRKRKINGLVVNHPLQSEPSFKIPQLSRTAGLDIRACSVAAKRAGSLLFTLFQRVISIH